MGFLKTLGSILSKGFAIWAGFAPEIQQAIPGSAGVVQTISKDLTEIADVIVQVETMGASLNLTGDQKLTAAASQVRQIVIDSAIVAGRPIADTGAFNRNVDGLASAIVGILNSLHPDAAVTTPASVKPLTPAV